MHREEKERSPSPSFVGHRGRGGNKSPSKSFPHFGFGGESVQSYRNLSRSSTATHMRQQIFTQKH